MRIQITSWVSLLVVVLSVSAWADDFYPPNTTVRAGDVPTWVRGAPLSTAQQWEFGTSTNPLVPDGTAVQLRQGGYLGAPFDVNPNTRAVMTGLTWAIGDGDGTWTNPNAADGTIELYIRNWVDLQPVKHLRLQISYDHPASGSNLPLDVTGIKDGATVAVNQGTGFNGNQNGLTPPLSTSDQHYLFQAYDLTPNPDWEKITITVPQDFSIDQIVVDTISIPEPASLAILGLGFAALLLRRRQLSNA